MEEVNRENILRILTESLRAIKDYDATKIRELSNQTIHSSSIYQDIDNISVAILMYSISKIIERTDYWEMESWNSCYKILIKKIDNALRFLLKYNINEFRNELKSILKEVSHLDPKLKKHILEVFHKAKINKGSRIYEHGISLGRVSEILGINKWELSEYVGKTGISDKGISMDIIRRVEYAKKIFNL